MERILWICFLLVLIRPAVLPAVYDWRDHSAVTEVKDQGACQAGWAFSVVAAYQSFLLSTQGVSYDLSEEYLIQCSGAGNCATAISVVSAMDFVVPNGVPTRSDLPYASGTYTSEKAPENGACSSNTVKSPNRVTSRVFTMMTPEFLKSQLHKGVLVSGINMAPDMKAYNGTGSYQCLDSWSSINSETDQIWKYLLPNHFVLLVGYDSSSNFIFKNSYGKTWGSAGYGKVAAGYDCGIRTLALQLSELWLHALTALILPTLL